MRKLEQEFADALTVVGVHAGKFTTERVTGQIALALERLGITHPVVNDRQFRTWRRYAVQAWPTLVFVSPGGHYLGTYAGEAPYEGLRRAVADLIADGERGGDLVRSPSLGADQPSHDAALRFPGALARDATGRLAVADAGHHRVLLGRLDAAATTFTVEEVVGSGAEGHADGAFAEAALAEPRGLAFEGHSLYVADAANQRILAADLEAKVVRTIAGTGERLWGGTRQPVPARGADLASPWGLARVGRQLFVAMAGSHQIWKLDLAVETLAPFAGSGAESLDDGILGGATLAQPSGLVPLGQRLYFADAESSAIRWADLATGFGERAVHTVVGTGLFDFGDRDGTGEEVRLQHPTDVAAWDGRLVVADTYNHRLKLVEPDARRVTTLTTAPALGGFNEPEAVLVTGEVLLVADTNNHRLVAASLRGDGCDESSLHEVTIRLPPM